MEYIVAILSSLILIFSAFSPGSSLNFTYYDKTCPRAESIISNVVKSAVSANRTVPAGLLRMHFHDCFIRGCDASVLLDSKGNNKAEKEGIANVNSLHGLFVIDSAKKAVEASCPGVVSCADILALATRDAVVLSGGPTWDVPKGRKDGRASKASDTNTLPAPSFNISQLQQSFAQRGLSIDDVVALSGAHAIGVSHCSSFENRIRKFNATHDIDPSMQPSFAQSLRSICPINNGNPVTQMVPPANTFNNTYYKLVLEGKGLFSSDHALLSTPKTKELVSKFASSPEAFRKAFAASMIKMSSIVGGEEIRRNCRVVN